MVAAAAILAGGRATRFGGQVKPLLEVGGQRILDRQLAVLRALFSDIAIVADDPSPFSDAGVPVLADEVQGQGPLGGIAAALSWSPCERVFVVAGDMPFLRADVIERLLAEPGCVAPARHGLPDPLHAVYQLEALPVIRRRLAARERKTAAVLREMDAVFVDANELRRFDPELRCLTNVNTPADLQNADASVRS